MNKLIVFTYVFIGALYSAQKIDVSLKDASQRMEYSGVNLIKHDPSIKLRLGNPSFKSKINDPWVIVDGVVTHLNSPSITSDKIKSVNVFKDKSHLPKQFKFLEGKVINGIIEIKLKTGYKIESVALKQYNENLKLPLDRSVFIDGVEIDDSSLLVDVEMIKDVSWVEVDGQTHVALFIQPKIFKEIQ